LEAQQSALDPAGPYARRIISMGTVFVVLLGLIFLVVVVLALVPLLRRHRGIGQEPLEETHRPSAGTERRMAVAVGIATAMTVVILFGLVVLSVSMGRTAGAPLSRPNSIAVEVTGNQWWWQIRYLNDNPRMVFTTANEMHIPVGLPILIRGTSHDVIHSFWIPGLQGKRDLIPSRITTEWIQADRPGHFRGQCAEFCGLQHAHMAMWVVAEPKEQFRNWLARQLQPAVAPGDSARQRGQQVFLESACALCHSIQGTDAGGQSGPDLTHFGSRLTIAAGTLPNTPGNLAGWIADPENVKPGNHMATVPVASEDLQPLVEYLESLQ
jgi:cytochrome c oxidase subunit 2